MGSDLPTIGPKSAETLQQFVDGLRPPMPEREQVEVMIAKLSLATASQKRSQEEEAERLELYWLTLRIYPLGRSSKCVSKATANVQVYANTSGDRFGCSE